MSAVKLIVDQLNSIYQGVYTCEISKEKNTWKELAFIELTDVLNGEVKSLRCSDAGALAGHEQLAKIMCSLMSDVVKIIPATYREDLVDVVHSLYPSEDRATITKLVRNYIVSSNNYYITPTNKDKLPRLSRHNNPVSFLRFKKAATCLNTPGELYIVDYAEEYNSTLIIDGRHAQRLESMIKVAREKISKGNSIFSKLDSKDKDYWVNMRARIMWDESVDVRFPTGYRFERKNLSGKGKEDHRCNVNACQIKTDVKYYNKVMRAYYCNFCMRDISKNNPGLFM